MGFRRRDLRHRVGHRALDAQSPRARLRRLHRDRPHVHRAVRRPPAPAHHPDPDRSTTMTTTRDPATPPRTTVRIPTASGDEIEAWVYRPQGEGPHPPAVMAHG